MKSGAARSRLIRRLQLISGLLLLVWLLAGGFLFFLAASVTMPVDGNLWAHPAFRDWATIALPLVATFLLLTMLRALMAVSPKE